MAELILKGQQEVMNKLLAIANATPKKIAGALYKEGNRLMTISKKRVPHDLGNLEASGIIYQPVISGNNISVTLGYGGAAVDYALIVHENLEADHSHNGRQAKYLSSVLDENASSLAENIAKSIKLADLVA